MSAAATSDILLNYTRLPMTTLEDLQNHPDDPSNGMTLESNARTAYDKFFWCLKSTGVSITAFARLNTANNGIQKDVYTVKVLNCVGIIRLPPDNLIPFRDQSSDLSPSSISIEQNRNITLPNPRYFAIHAAIAGILHTSTAGKFIDELLDQYKDVEGKVPPVQSWSELERLMEEGVLRDSVESMNLVGVH